MQSKLKLDHHTRAVAMATGGAAIAAIAAMFIPTGIWETLTGATGVSEMIPATGAPLGDKARALISFTFGALTLAIPFFLPSPNSCPHLAIGLLGL